MTNNLDTLAMQYKRIPANQDFFKGYGGFPVAFIPGDDSQMHDLRALMFDSLNPRVVNKYRQRLAQADALGSYLVDDSPVHNLIIGPTRGGKGQSYVLPMLENLSRGSDRPSAIVHDPKGELYATLAATYKGRGYNVQRLTLDGSHSASWNPLVAMIQAAQREDADALNLATDALAWMLVPFTNEKDPFWENAVRGLIKNITLFFVIDHAFSFVDHKGLTLTTEYPGLTDLLDAIANELNVRMERLGDRDNSDFADLDLNYAYAPYMTAGDTLYTQLRQFDPLAKTFIRRQMQIAMDKVTQLVGGSEKTFGSIMSIAAAALDPWHNDLIRRVSTANDIDLSAFREVPTVLFLQPSLVTPSFNRLISRLIQAAYTEFATAAIGTPELPRRVHFVIDELTMLPHIADMATKMSFGAGLGLLFTLVIQDLTQLNDLYGDAAHNILANAGNVAFLGGETYTASYVAMRLQGSDIAQLDAQHLGRYESVVLRLMVPATSRDQTGKPTPIVHTGTTDFMPHYWMFHEEVVAPTPTPRKQDYAVLSTVAFVNQQLPKTDREELLDDFNRFTA